MITGLIKANIPTRIAFTVFSKIDSRTILDQGGAESLLGMGTCLFRPNSTMPVRVHGAFVRDQEVHAVVQDWKARGRPQYVDGITSDSESEGGGGGFDGGEELDALFDQAVNFVTQKRKASISGVQRQFRIGYNRAARIIEQMEAQGIVSAQGIMVIVKCWLRRLLSKLVSRMALCRLPSGNKIQYFLLSSC